METQEVETQEVETTCEHEVGCNCEDCWWANDQQEVDEFGVPW